jgi:hypothetical protein
MRLLIRPSPALNLGQENERSSAFHPAGISRSRKSKSTRVNRGTRAKEFTDPVATRYNSFMIRLAQYTKELDRLAKLEMDEEADREFERICADHIGIDFGDLFEADVTRIETIVPSPGIAAGVCKSLGYDIMIGETETVMHWWGFSVLIVARSENIVPTDPRLRAKRRAAVEADDLLHADGEDEDDEA